MLNKIITHKYFKLISKSTLSIIIALSMIATFNDLFIKTYNETIIISAIFLIKLLFFAFLISLCAILFKLVWKM